MGARGRGEGNTKDHSVRIEEDKAALAIRCDSEEDSWTRLKGETARQFAAFEIFRGIDPYDRTVVIVRKILGLKSAAPLYRWSTLNHWKARAVAWDEAQAQIKVRAAEKAIEDMAKNHVQSLAAIQVIANLHLRQVARHVQRQIDQDGDCVPDYLSPKDLIAWVSTAQQLETQARLRTYDMAAPGGLHGHAAAAEEHSSLADWRATYVDQAVRFQPHEVQGHLIRSMARFVIAVAGVQSGKTAGTAIAFHNRIASEREELAAKGEVGFYWLIAPTTVVGEVMCEAFEAFAPPGVIESKKGSLSGMTWTLSNGAKVQFRSGKNADTLVARRLHGAWIDEFTMLKKDIWVVSVRQRLLTTSGWCYFSGTPRGKNWAFDELWCRADPTHDRYDRGRNGLPGDYAGFTWHSEVNPSIPSGEIKAAKRQLPKAYYEREYRASWESFHGQIYEHWNASKHVVKGLRERLYPTGTESAIGIDWGTSTPGCALAIRFLPNGQVHIVGEVYMAGKLPAWWDEKIAGLWEEFRATRIYSDPEDPGRRKTLVSQGLPARQANNEVHAGIRTLASLIKQGLLFVDEACKFTVQQLETYHWATDAKGNAREYPHKENDHACDAARYGIHTHLLPRARAKTTGYGSGAR